jgi:hypothetical protein
MALNRLQQEAIAAKRKRAKMARIRDEMDSGKIVFRRVGERPAGRETVCAVCEADIEVGDMILGSVHAGCAPLKGPPDGAICGICGATIDAALGFRKLRTGWAHEDC